MNTGQTQWHTQAVDSIADRTHGATDSVYRKVLLLVDVFSELF